MAQLAISGNQPTQHVFLWDLAPGETCYQGGLGSGKSWAAARKLLILHAHNRCQGLAVAPTYGDLHRFVIPALISALDEWHWPYKDRSSDPVMPMIIVGDWPILLLSGDTPERFAGFEVGHIWIDEGARLVARPDNPLRCAPTQIRTRLRHPVAKSLHLLVTTTPEGLETWIQRDFFINPTPRRRAYIGLTRGNRALPPEYITSLLSSFPPELAKQYMEGIAQNLASNRAHPGFVAVTGGNVGERPFVDNLPVHLGADYNVDPMCWLLSQHVGDELRFLDELILTGGTTVDVAMTEAHGKGWGKWVVHLHPDKSSKARSTVGDPEFVVMQRTATALQWRHSGTSAGVNPPVAARIANLSRLCLDATGARRLVVHPRCKRLIEEFSNTGRLSSGQYDPGPTGSRGHILDAAGYVAWDLFAPRAKAGAVDLP